MGETQWVTEQLALFEQKFQSELARLGTKIPHYAKVGVYHQNMAKEDITWWTNGFLGGILWQLSDQLDDPRYQARAEQLEAQLDQAFLAFNGLHHDVGFMWLHTAVADYRRTHSPLAKRRALHAATLLAGRFNPEGHYLRSWNEDKTHWVIIDSLMNIPLLYWASAVTGDSRFKQMAMQHADTVLANHIRADGSVNHIVIFDEAGTAIETPGGQGFGPGSAWSRGQAWAIYGMVLSFQHTGEMRYLDAAKRVAHYFIANVVNTGYIPLVDFRAPQEPVKYDTSAGLCAACGMLAIASAVPEAEQAFYHMHALKLVQAISAKAADWTPEHDGIIGFGTGAYHDANTLHVSLIYSDYFFLEALLRLSGQYQEMW
ncbi:glycoside hydrolase family 88 protein [Lacticaseibacillus jixiensis]|uniref:glycoside hydrolase family 88 protein n=1 Tax=Lacticaseibacillus jixiensis TaxID=3231926 RepID=UPI0036F36337